MAEWIKITTKYDTKCIQCGADIDKDEQVLWLKDLGVKHEDCPIYTPQDNSELKIIDV